MSKAYNITESGLVQRGNGTLRKVIINSHTSGTVKIYDGTEGGAAATSTLTSAGACAPATHAVNVLTSTGAMVAGSHATSVLTGDAVVAGNVVVIGDITYTARDTFTSGSTAYEVLIGGSTETFLANLADAINGTGDNTKYGDGTVAHPDVVCSASDATTLTVWARVPGTTPNSIATTGTALRTVWADTTLGGGTGASNPGVTVAAATVTIDTTVYTAVVELSETAGADAVAYQVLYGGSVAAFLDNLKLAINGTGVEGTNYSTGTVAHPKVVATTNTDTAQTIRARVPGTVYNTIATTETLANTAWADTTLGGGTGASDAGVTTANAQFTIGDQTYTAVIELSESLGANAIANQILWVTSEAVFLDNIKKTINGSGIAGTDYSTGTLRNYWVEATTNTDTTQVIKAKKAGTAGNSIATTETLANYSWTSTVMAGGTGANGEVISDTITFSTIATTGERVIDFGTTEFTNGLYLTIGGTANLTVIVD